MEKGHEIIKNNHELPGNIKWTKQRKEVCEILRHAVEPLSAIDIYQQILNEQEKDASSYAVSTVYRALTVFEENGLVSRSVLTGSDTAVYEWNEGEHKHYAVCLNCHKLIPLKECPFAHIHVDTNIGDFTVTGHKLELYGYCKQCKGEGK